MATARPDNAALRGALVRNMARKVAAQRTKTSTSGTPRKLGVRAAVNNNGVYPGPPAGMADAARIREENERFIPGNWTGTQVPGSPGDVQYGDRYRPATPGGKSVRTRPEAGHRIRNKYGPPGTKKIGS
jgi:hypothetical protein